MNYLKYFDFVGQNISFEINSETKFKSVQGVIISLIVSIFAIVASFMFGKELWDRKIPKVAISKQIIDNSDFLMEDFPIMLSFHYLDAYNIKSIPNFFDVYGFYYVADLNGEVKRYDNYTISRCEDALKSYSEKSQKNIKNVIYNNTNTEFYCLNVDKNLRVKNLRLSPNSSSPVLIFSQCNTTFTRSSCKDRSIIGEQVTVILTMFDNYVNSFSYENPVVENIKVVMSTISPTLTKVLHLDITKDIFFSDNGWIFENIIKIEYINFESTTFDYSISKNIYYYEFGVSVSSLKMRNSTSREYLKVQELFARIGGIFNALLIFMNCLTAHYMRFVYLKSIDKLTEIDENNEKKDELNFKEENAICNNNLNFISSSNLVSKFINPNPTLKLINSNFNNILNTNMPKNEKIIKDDDIKNKSFKISNQKDLVNDSLLFTYSYLDYLKVLIFNDIKNEHLKNLKSLIAKAEIKIKFENFLRFLRFNGLIN